MLTRKFLFASNLSTFLDEPRFSRWESHRLYLLSSVRLSSKDYLSLPSTGKLATTNSLLKESATLRDATFLFLSAYLWTGCSDRSSPSNWREMFSFVSKPTKCTTPALTLSQRTWLKFQALWLPLCFSFWSCTGESSTLASFRFISSCC